MYIEMNENIQRYNTFRNRWVGAYLAEKGIRVIPTVNWGLENTFDFCFNGIEKGSTVAVSTYMASAHGNRASQERHYTDHGYPTQHSSPHDHPISWDKERGNPIWGNQINYFEGNIPEFKYFKKTGAKDMNNEYNDDFKTKFEFIESVGAHSEIVFEWKGQEYGVFIADDDKWCICLDKTGLNDIILNTLDDVLNFKIDGEKLIDICTKITVLERVF